MDFSDELKLKQKLINNYLENLFVSTQAPKSILDSMNYSLLAGGKRIRPILVISIYESLGGKAEDILSIACSVELIHTYSLIHDDLPAMDNDDFRRGKETNHIKFGEDMAILAGDGLLNYAFELMFKAIKESSYNKKYIDASSVIAEAAGVSGMIGGQVIDIESSNKDINIDKLYEMHRKKTGALIEASCMAGCILSPREDILDKVKEYGQNLGIAFQIVDDILDYEGDSKILGKKTGMDDKNNKSTFVTILGINESKEIAKKYSEKAMILAEDIDKSEFLTKLTNYLLYRSY